jgi:hypothetical protein
MAKKGMIAPTRQLIACYEDLGPWPSVEGSMLPLYRDSNLLNVAWVDSDGHTSATCHCNQEAKVQSGRLSTSSDSWLFAIF